MFMTIKKSIQRGSAALVAIAALGFASGAFTQTSTLSASAQTALLLQAQGIPDPAQQYRDMTRMLRNNDLASLVRIALPAGQYQALQTGFNTKRQVPINDANRKEFAESWGTMIAPNAVELWMDNAKPKLEQARQQLPAALMMGMGALQMAVYSKDNELTDAQRSALQTALPNIQSWLNEADFLSESKLREVALIITTAARRTGIARLEDVQALNFDQALAKADGLLQAAKQSANVYGLNVDAILDSLRVTTLTNDGKNARIKTTITLFGADIDHEQELVLLEGRWVGKELAQHAKIQFNLEKQES
jgi:hypothetical protein